MPFENLEKLMYKPLLKSDIREPGVLRELEREIGGGVPEDFADFLQRYPETGIFGVSGVVFISSDDRLSGRHDGRYAIDMLYAACPKKRYDVLAIRKKRAESDSISVAYLCIGEDSFGNFFCLDLRSDSSGGVYFWDHEHSDDETGLHFVAPNFTTFIDRLEVDVS